MRWRKKLKKVAKKLAKVNPAARSVMWAAKNPRQAALIAGGIAAAAFVPGAAPAVMHAARTAFASPAGQYFLKQSKRAALRQVTKNRWVTMPGGAIEHAGTGQAIAPPTYQTVVRQRAQMMARRYPYHLQRRNVRWA